MFISVSTKKNGKLFFISLQHPGRLKRQNVKEQISSAKIANTAILVKILMLERQIITFSAIGY